MVERVVRGVGENVASGLYGILSEGSALWWFVIGLVHSKWVVSDKRLVVMVPLVRFLARLLDGIGFPCLVGLGGCFLVVGFGTDRGGFIFGRWGWGFGIGRGGR